jgi:TatD DNase family protein
MLIDTHCHLDFDLFDEDRTQVIDQAVESGVQRIIVPAIDLENCPVVIKLAKRYENIFAAVGVHPNSSAGWQDSWIEALRDFAQHEKVIAIGEIGLDYYWDRSPKEVQHRALSQQLALAAELELPVIIHNRDSSADVLRLLAESPLNGRPNPGVLHSFSGNWETAAAALEMGFYLGFTGPVTFKKADDLRRIATQVPLDRILVETDAPFLAPQPRRGKRNEPAFVTYTAQRLADILALDFEVFARQTTENAAKLFGPKLLEIKHGPA